MINLYPYQQQGINELRESYKEHQRILFVMPTGSGKTVVFSSICAASVNKGKRVLILSDRVELFSQTIKTISKHNIEICKVDAENKFINPNAGLYVGMIETFKRRMSQFVNIPIDIIIVDEAHKNCFYKVFEAFPNVKVLGCTATPVGKRLYKYYTKLIQPIDVPELIESGFLSPCISFQMQDDFSDLRIDKKTNDFSEDSNFKHFDKAKLYNGVVDKWLEKAPLKKTIVFNCNIEHALKTTEMFNMRGIKSFCISAKTPKKERDYILREFEVGRFPVLNNANILVAGYDCPSVECVIMNRATAMINVWLQAVGRGSRIFPGKKNFTVIDFGGNFTRHGLWQLPRTWKLEPPKKKKSGGAVAPIKRCTQCEAIVATSTTICPHCGFLFPNKTDQLREGELVEVGQRIPENLINKNIADLSVNELIELERCGRFKPAYIWRIVRTRGEHALGEYAIAKGYKDGWVRNQLELMDGGSVGFSNVLIS